jgi:plastocyanin
MTTKGQKGVTAVRRGLLALMTAVALVVATPAATAHAATASVLIKRTAYSPAKVTITDGDAVTWKNVDTINHQVVANGGSFASAILAPGKTYTFTFHRAGTFKYHDGLHPTLTGTIVVKGPPPSVTLAASPPIITFGNQVTLSGVVSNKKTNETVTLTGQPIGTGSPQVIATLKTTTGGAFSFVVTPQVYTTYGAQWNSTSAGSVTVQVAPQIRLPGPRHGYFHTYVSAAKSFAGHWVYLQRLSQFGEWVSFRRLTLGSRSGRIFAVSSLPRGRYAIRIFITVNQAGLGYLSAHSGSQRVVRR